MIYILVEFAIAGVLETQYIVQNCDGPPVLINSYPATISTNISILASNFASATTCGSAPLPVENCCITSADPAFSPASFEIHDYKSALDLPSSANGYEYCDIFALDSTALNQYTFTKVLNINLCISNYICNNTGLHVYEFDHCTGDVELFSAPGIRNSRFLGNISVSNEKIGNAMAQFDWIACFPYYMCAPDSKSMIGMLAFLSCAIAVTTFGLSTIYYAKSYLTNQTLSNLSLCVVQFTWCVRAIFTMAAVYCAIKSVAGNNMLSSIGSISCICTFMQSLLTCQLILDILKFPNKSIGYGFYALLTIIQLGLAAPIYFNFLVFFLPYDEYLPFSLISYQLYAIWEYVAFALDLVPPMLIYYRLLKLDVPHSAKEDIQEFNQRKSKVLAVLFLEIFNITAMFFIYYVQLQTNWLGSDRNFGAIWGVIFFVYLLHNVTILYLFSQLKILLQVKIGKRSKRKSSIRRSSGLSSSSKKRSFAEGST